MTGTETTTKRDILDSDKKDLIYFLKHLYDSLMIPYTEDIKSNSITIIGTNNNLLTEKEMTQ